MSTETVAVIYDYFDVNDDPEVFGESYGTQIRWYRNWNNSEPRDGYYVPALDNMLSLSPDITVAHENWTASVIPGDGFALGVQVNSTSTVIVNSPPEVTDKSPEYVLSLDHITLNIGDSQTFSFTCREIDLDPVTVQWQVNSVNATDLPWISYTEYTTDSFTYTFTALGSYTVRVRLTDAGYGYQTTTQSWSILIR